MKCCTRVMYPRTALGSNPPINLLPRLLAGRDFDFDFPVDPENCFRCHGCNNIVMFADTE